MAHRSLEDLSLTAIEYERLDLPGNVADGHAKLSPVEGLQASLSLTSIARSAQRDLEGDFLAEFAKHSRSHNRRTIENSWLATSASAAIDATMKYLRSIGARSIGILEPTFDNIPALARRAGLRALAIEEFDTVPDAIAEFDAVFLVIPNNPTGWIPAEQAFNELLIQMARQRQILVVDRAFRFFRDSTFIERAMLCATGLQWIQIDDTGKTWSTLENKVSVVTSSESSIINEIRAIGEEITLNVSAVALSLCTYAMRLERGARRVRTAVASNGTLLRRRLDQSSRGLVKVSKSGMSVATVHFDPALGLTGTDFAEQAAATGSGVLPGRHFYWSSPSRGHYMVRVALARDEDLFERAICTLGDLVLHEVS